MALNQLKHENMDVINENCIRDDAGKLVTSEKDRLTAWKSYYEHLLNKEFPWNRDELTPQEPVGGPAIFITEDMTLTTIR